MECITTVNYSLLINGNSKGNIHPSRGIRQGDPLSPYIFILCVEFLGKELLIHSENPKNQLGIQTHRNGPRIPFLMFANDCIIFAKASHKACFNINIIFHNFYAMSGQLVHFHKSSIQFSNSM